MLSIVVDKENVKLDMINITDKGDIMHIANTYRLKSGDDLRVVDGQYEYMCKIVKISKKEVLVKIENKKEDRYSLDINIDIAIGLIKNDKMNLLIQKLTELGVNTIIPLKTERVVVKIDSKKEKWEDTVRESMKQCRAVVKTKISDIKKINELDYAKYDKIFFLYENSSENKKIYKLLTENDKNVLCIIGPEGGFTSKEVEFFTKNKGIEISLGNRILRAETAAIYATCILAHSYGY